VTRAPTRGRSVQAARLYADLMAVDPPVRRGFLAGLELEEKRQVLAVAARESGTPYGLWADDPVGFVEDVLGETLWSLPRQILGTVPGSRRVAVPSCFASSKCVYRGERLMLADGGLAKAEDLVGHEFEMLGWSENGTQTVRRARAEWNAVEPVYRVETDTGRQVVRNGHHPLYAADNLRRVRSGGQVGTVIRTPSNLGWRAVEGLAKGDLVLVPEVVHPRTTERMRFEEAALLGYLLGDGHTVKEVRFSHLPGDTLDEFIRCVEVLGGRVKDYPVKAGRRHREIVVRGVGERGEGTARRHLINPVWNLVKRWGLAGKRATEKTLPDFVWRLHPDDLAVIMSRLFACDGWASHGTNTKAPNSSSIGVSLANEQLIRDIQRVMLRLGVPGRVSATYSSLNGKRYPYWTWIISSAHDMRRFAEVMDVPGKQEKIRAALVCAEKRRHTHLWQHRNAPDGYRWEKVRSVERLPDVERTVAIEVDSDHTWVDLFVEHNTWTAARCALWFALTRPVGTALVVTIAPQWRQVIRQLWPEIRNAHSRAGLIGNVDATQLKLPDAAGHDVVAAYGLAAPPYNETAVQGIHCFDAETELLTDEGWKPFPQVRGDERVLTLPPESDVAEWGPITEVIREPFDGYLNEHDGTRVNFCVTDNHRFLVRGRGKEYARHGRITRTVAQKIKDQKAAGASVTVLAEKYGVSKSLIYQIVQGRRDRALTDQTDGPRWRLIEYADLPETFIVRRTNTWGGDNPDTVVLEIDKRPYRKAERYEFDFGDWCEFLGWFVAEGSARTIERGCIRVAVSQQPGEKFEAIGALLDRMGIRWHRQAHDLTFSSDAIGLWLREHCGVGSANKRIPFCVKEARPEMIRRFLDAFGRGDGAAHTHADSRRYVTSSLRLADDLHEVMAKIGTARKMRVMHETGSVGRITRGGKETVFTRDKPTFMLNEAGRPADSDVHKRNVKRVRYTGEVHCVSTPHQTIMVRRRGCPMWSGNSANLLLIVDEAGGIGQVIGRNLRAMLTGNGTHMLAIGNPPTDDESSWFEMLCDTADVTTIPIRAADTPNLSGEDAPRCKSCPPEVPHHSLAAHLVDRTWVEETVREHGEDSNYVIAKVHAGFPKGGPARAIPSTWVDAAAAADEPDGPGHVSLDELEGEREGWAAQRGAWVRLGVDVAADGGDEFAVARAVGDLAQMRHISSGLANIHPMDVAGVILQEIRQAERVRDLLGTEARVRVKIDAIGVGWGVAGILSAWGAEGLHGAEIVPVVVSEATDREPDAATLRPHRKRDEMWLAMRAVLQPGKDGGGALRLRVDARTLAQLRAPTLGTSSSGHTKIESKDSLKQRGLSSPDRAEALLMAVYEPAPPARKKRKARLVA
jgi:intein/homing endonuclease